MKHFLLPGLLALTCHATASVVQAAPRSKAAPSSKTASRPISLPMGSPERKVILDALRQPLSRYRKTPLKFVYARVYTINNWAYIEAATVDGKGRKIGNPMTSSVQALLKKTSRWQVMKWAYPTDVISIEWERQYPQVPKTLWPHHRWKNAR